MLPAAGSLATSVLQFHGPGDMMGGMGWMMWGAWIFGVLFWVAVLVLLLVVIWKLVGGGSTGSGGTESPAEPEGELPLAILERRYAAGEIDREEFLEKREDLRDG